MTTKALMFHPEFPTLWGYRRQILSSPEIIAGDSEDSQQLKKKLLEGEMKLLDK